MTFAIILPVVALITLAISSYTDIRTREVPDWVSYSLIFSALGIRGLTLDPYIILSGIFGLAAAYVVAAALYYSHQWGGADSKLLMGMGAVIGITFPFTTSSGDLLLFLFLLLFSGAVYSLIWMIYAAIKNWKKFYPLVKENAKGHKLIFIIAWVSKVAFITLTLFYHSFWPLILFPLPLFYIFILVTTIEEQHFLKSIPLKHLTEGDWLAGPIKYNKKSIVTSKTVTEDDMKLLKKYFGKIKKVNIKEGIPFVPSFLIGYLILLVGKSYILTLI